MQEDWTKNGGPAAPVALGSSLPDQHAASSGLSLRDYFAAKALQGFTAGAFWSEVDNDEAAKAAYDVADAMLKARKK